MQHRPRDQCPDLQRLCDHRRLCFRQLIARLYSDHRTRLARRQQQRWCGQARGRRDTAQPPHRRLVLAANPTAALTESPLIRASRNAPGVETRTCPVRYLSHVTARSSEVHSRIVLNPSKNSLMARLMYRQFRPHPPVGPIIMPQRDRPRHALCFRETYNIACLVQKIRGSEASFSFGKDGSLSQVRSDWRTLFAVEARLAQDRKGRGLIHALQKAPGVAFSRVPEQTQQQ